MPADDSRQDAFLEAVGEIGAPLLSALTGFELLARRLHPPAIPELRSAFRPLVERLEAAQAAFSQVRPVTGLEGMAEALSAAAETAVFAGRLFSDEAPPHEAIARLLGAMRASSQAQAKLFPLADVLPPVHRFFLEPAVHALHPLPFAAASGERPLGLFQAADGSDERGGFSLYVPPLCDGDGPWPLVVALHGGSGHGSEFLWTWLREARSRGFLLLAPSSRGTTWSLDAPELDGRALRRMVDFVSERWPLDRERILLTGLSDGATFALLTGLHLEAPYSALAPVAGVLHPANFALGNLERARGRRIYQVHGARDWLFPVALAHMARDALAGAGADLVYRELPELSHAYPRDENARILAWFDPGLEPVGR